MKGCDALHPLHIKQCLKILKVLDRAILIIARREMSFSILDVFLPTIWIRQTDDKWQHLSHQGFCGWWSIIRNVVRSSGMVHEFVLVLKYTHSSLLSRKYEEIFFNNESMLTFCPSIYLLSIEMKCKIKRYVVGTYGRKGNRNEL